jgi:hypothetical protein
MGADECVDTVFENIDETYSNDMAACASVQHVMTHYLTIGSLTAAVLVVAGAIPWWLSRRSSNRDAPGKK